jgi:hypothetical protein
MYGESLFLPFGFLIFFKLKGIAVIFHLLTEVVTLLRVFLDAIGVGHLYGGSRVLLDHHSTTLVHFMRLPSLVFLMHLLHVVLLNVNQ